MHDYILTRGRIQWHLEYLTTDGSWAEVSVTSGGGYPTEATDEAPEVGFETVQTTGLRAVLAASGSGGQFGGIGVKEWMAFTPEDA